jgi:hypothetical protein
VARANCQLQRLGDHIVRLYPAADDLVRVRVRVGVGVRVRIRVRVRVQQISIYLSIF